MSLIDYNLLLTSFDQCRPIRYFSDRRRRNNTKYKASLHLNTTVYLFVINKMALSFVIEYIVCPIQTPKIVYVINHSRLEHIFNAKRMNYDIQNAHTLFS